MALSIKVRSERSRAVGSNTSEIVTILGNKPRWLDFVVITSSMGAGEKQQSKIKKLNCHWAEKVENGRPDFCAWLKSGRWFLVGEASSLSVYRLSPGAQPSPRRPACERSWYRGVGLLAGKLDRLDEQQCSVVRDGSTSQRERLNRREIGETSGDLKTFSLLHQFALLHRLRDRTDGKVSD